VSGHNDGNIRVWDLESEVPIKEILVSSAGITSLSV